MPREIMYGPIQFSAIAFEGTDVIEDIIKELYFVREVGIIRLIDFIFIEKDADGDISILDVSDLSDEERIKMGAVIGGLIGYGAGGEKGAELGAELGAYSVAENDFGLIDEDILEVVEELPLDSSACLVLFEHTWAKGLKQAMVDHGGILLAQGLIHPYSLIAVGAELAEAVNEEETWESEQKKMNKGTSTKEIEKKSTKKASKKKPKTKKVAKK